MPKKTTSARKKPNPNDLRNLDLEISFLEGIIQRDPAYIEALQILGDDYTRRGRFDEGLKIDESLASFCPEEPLVHYNLACSYSLTEQFDLAVESLETAIKLGYRDFPHLAKDPDLKKLRAHASYEKLRGKIRELQGKAK
jgi:tetratricopeptide (TPR) repeat protein